MKKFSLITNENIRKHLANNSPAKITHSFSKSRRFLDPNPEYPHCHTDAKRPTMVALLRSPNATAASASAAGQISPRAPSSPPPLLPILLLHSSISSARPTASASVAKNLQKEITSTTSARHAFLDQAQYSIAYSVRKSVPYPHVHQLYSSSEDHRCQQEKTFLLGDPLARTL